MKASAIVPSRIALLLALLVPVDAVAQQHLLGSFSLADGLPQSQIWDIQQDHDGFVWFATYGGGVAMFDGQAFTVLTTDDGLASNSVYAIQEDHEGVLWFGTRAGVTRMRGGVLSTAPGIPGATKVFDLASGHDGSLWAATEHGIFLLVDGTFERAGPVEVSTGTALTTTSGDVWFGTSSDGAYRFRNGVWTRFGAAEGLSDGSILSIYQPSDGSLWFGTEEGVVRMNDGHVDSFNTEDGLPNNRVHAIVEDHLGLIWLGTDLGVTRFDGSGFEAIRSQVLEALPVWSLATDLEQNVYIGTSGKGVFFYNHSPFTHVNGMDRFDGRTVWNITQDASGHYWFGLEGGLKRFSFDSMQDLGFDDSLFRTRSVRAVTTDDQGQVWIGSSRGIWLWDSGAMREIRTRDGERVPDVRAIRQGPSGTIWVGTVSAGAFRYDGRVLDPIPDLAGDEIYDVLEASDGNVWFMGGEGVVVMTESGVRRIGLEDGLSHPLAVAAVEDRFGRIWIGTYGGGLNVLVEPLREGEEVCFDVVRAEQGLTDDTVLFMAIGPSDDLWVGSNRGLSRLDLEVYATEGRASVRRYGQYEGFIGIEANLHAAFRDSQDAMWFGHVEGVSRFESGATESPVRIPDVQITGIRLFLEKPDWSTFSAERKRHGLPGGLRLQPSQNHVTFDFVGLSFRAAERVVYRHKLEGFDEDWSPAHTERLATYSNLTPGEYTFRVQASVDGVNWSPADATYSFELLPPFWMTWWFGLIFLTGFGGLLYGLHDARTRALRNRQRLLETTVSERTAALIEAREDALRALQVKSQFLANMSHEIRTPMNGVLGFASLLAESELNREQREYVDVIRTSGDSLLGIINDILDYSKIEAGKTRIEQAPFSARRVVERVLELLSAKASEKGIELVGDVAPDVPEIVSGDETRLQQILLNLAANAVKFTDSGEVAASVRVSRRDARAVTLVFRIEDTGIGIPPDRLKSLFAPFTQADASTTRKYGGTGLGLAISDRLCTLMGGTLGVESQEGTGSTFHFELRLPYEAAAADSDPTDEFRGKRLLLAMHNARAARAVEDQLVHWGAEVEVFSTAEKADRAWVSGEFDAALVDAEIEDIRRLHDHMTCERTGATMTPTISLYAPGRKVRLSGCCEEVSKPVKRAALLDAIRAALSQQEPAAPVVAPMAVSAHGEGLRLLVAEDNPTNRKLIARMLQRMGHRVYLVTNGQEAIDAVRTGDFDAVLMDVQMPVLDGLEACRRLRAEGATVPVVALTAAVLREDRERCAAAGMDDLVSKPVSPADLQRVLARVTEKGSAGPARDREARPRTPRKQGPGERTSA